MTYNNDDWLNPTVQTRVKKSLEDLQRREKPDDIEQIKDALGQQSGMVLSLHVCGYSVDQIVNAIRRSLPFVDNNIIRSEVVGFIEEHKDEAKDIDKPVGFNPKPVD